jgi:hypothetical protein
MTHLRWWVLPFEPDGSGALHELGGGSAGGHADPLAARRQAFERTGDFAARGKRPFLVTYKS